MARGFIVGLIFGLAAIVALMVLFPMDRQASEAPQAPAAPTSEGGGDGAGGATDGGDGTAPATPAEGEEPADDQTRAPDTEPPAAPADLAAAPSVPEQAAAPPLDDDVAAAPPGAPAAADGAASVDEPADAPLAEAAPEPDVATAPPPAETAAAPPPAETAAAPPAPVAREAAAQSGADAPAWRRNAIAFDDPGDRPLLAVVLTAVVSGPAPATPLSAIAAPVTLAVPAEAPSAAEAARLYRDAGRETLVLLALSPGGAFAPNMTEAEIAEAVRNLVESFDGAVGVANPGGGRNPELRVARVVMRELAAAGLGYLHAEGGAAGTVVRTAEDLGVPLARSARVIGPGLTAPEILQTLDLAAIDARRRGAAVAMGAPTDAMVRALLEWAEANDGKTARLAPFSAVLRRLSGAG